MGTYKDKQSCYLGRMTVRGWRFLVGGVACIVLVLVDHFASVHKGSKPKGLDCS